VAEKQPETHMLSNVEKETSGEDYVESETTVMRSRVQDAQCAIKQKPENMRKLKTWD
jgi:hypothetical protein